MNLLTVREAAERLGCSKALVYLLCAERRLAHLRIGSGRGTIRIRASDLDQFLSEAVVGTHSVQESLRHIRQRTGNSRDQSGTR